MNSALNILRENIHQVINPDFKIETVASDCRFTEGPVWNPKGYYLFSDIDANCIYKLTPGSPKEIYLDKSGTNHPAHGIRPDHAGSNALAYTSDGSLLICQHGDGAIAQWDGNSLQPLIAQYKGRRFNSPNDLVVSASDRVFFSDPPYGLTDTKLNPDLWQPIAGVYCYNGEEVVLVCDKYNYPNGVCLTPGEKNLLVCSTKENERFISVYDVETLDFKRVFAHENGDGMKCDFHGHIYLCTKEGIVILNQEGERIAVLKLATLPSNLCWGGTNKKDLLITARENVFLIRGFLV